MAATNATHTPGPWEAASIYINQSDGSSDTHIATASTYDVGEREACANARLIAAAPDLLEAVRAGGRYSDALRRYQGHGVRGETIPGTDDLERLFRDWHDKGHAALAKVEGRETVSDAPNHATPDVSRQTGTVLYYVTAPDDQQRVRRFDIVQGIVQADDGWIYAWRFGHVYRDFTTADKLQPGCRVSFEVDPQDPVFATGLSWKLGETTDPR
jgi:hypothetical protein